MKKFLGIITALVISSVLYGADEKKKETGHDRAVKATVFPEKGKVGTVFKYTVAVAGSGLEEIKVGLPEKKIIFPEKKEGKDRKKESTAGQSKRADSVPLFVIHRAFREDAEGGGQISVVLELSCYRPGTHTLPEISIKESDGIAVGYRLPEIVIEETNREGKPEDIEAPLDLSGNYNRLILLILGAAALTLLSVFIFRYIKKRRRREPDPEPDLPPIDIFLREIGRVKPAEKIASGDIHGYVFSISILFRRFLSAQYGFDAAEMTTDEISRRLGRYMQGGSNGDMTGEIIKSMQLWDLSKFAEFSPSAELLQQNLDSAIAIAKKIARHEEETDGEV